MKKYNFLYAKRTAAICFGITLPFCILFLVIFVLADKWQEGIPIISVSLIFAVAVWLILMLRILFAIHLLRYQEETLHLTFDDKGAKKTARSSIIFVCDDWFVSSGKLYLHRSFIESVSVKAKKRTKGKDYYCVFRCKNQKTYTVFMPSASEGKRVREWFVNGKNV